MTRPISYVDCDVPEGMTLEAYRATHRCEPRHRRLAELGRRTGGLLRRRARRTARVPRG